MRVRVLVTGATGFVGGWLTHELQAAGHEVTAAPGSAALDIADLAGVRAFVERARPDVIAHLAAVASAREAREDPERAVRTNIGGTVAVVEAARSVDPATRLLIVSSAEVYAPPSEGDPPLTEEAALAPRRPYGMLKLAQEAVAIAAAARHDLATVVVRPFNHIGPGQQPTAAVAAFAERIAAVRRGETDRIAVGTIDVERDIGDVRDYVVAYRLVMEALVEGRLGRPAPVLNVATGTAVSLRRVVADLCRLAGVDPRIEVDPALVRSGDPPRIVGDPRLLQRTVDWRPRIGLETTLADVLAAHLA